MSPLCPFNLSPAAVLVALSARPAAAGSPPVSGAKGREMVEEETSARRRTDLHWSTKTIIHTHSAELWFCGGDHRCSRALSVLRAQSWTAAPPAVSETHGRPHTTPMDGHGPQASALSLLRTDGPLRPSTAHATRFFPLFQHARNSHAVNMRH
jgi:hypothetical protein